MRAKEKKMQMAKAINGPENYDEKCTLALSDSESDGKERGRGRMPKTAFHPRI